MVNYSKRSQARKPPKPSAKSSAPESFPNQTLVAISHAEPALTNTSLLAWPISRRAARERARSSARPPHEAGVSRRERMQKDTHTPPWGGWGGDTPPNQTPPQLLLPRLLLKKKKNDVSVRAIV